MPVGRVKILFRPNNALAAAQFRALVEEALLTRPAARRVIDWAVEDRVMIFDVELTTRAAMRSFRQWFADNLSTLRSLGNGIAKACLCSHADATVIPCSDATASEYREVRL